MARKNLVQLMGMVIVFAGLVVSMIYFDGTKITSIVSSVITILAAIAGVIGFWYQMKRDADADQAQFIIELQKNFLEFGFTKIRDKMHDSDNKKDFNATDIKDMSSYITFFENISPMVFDGVLTLKLIDDLFSYNFFLVANHPVAQSERLIPYTEGWCGFVRLHKEWTAYKKQHNLPILREETSLDKVLPNYEFYSTPTIIRKKNKRTMGNEQKGF